MAYTGAYDLGAVEGEDIIRRQPPQQAAAEGAEPREAEAGESVLRTSARPAVVRAVAQHAEESGSGSKGQPPGTPDRQQPALSRNVQPAGVAMPGTKGLRISAFAARQPVRADPKLIGAGPKAKMRTVKGPSRMVNTP